MSPLPSLFHQDLDDEQRAFLEVPSRRVPRDVRFVSTPDEDNDSSDFGMSFSESIEERSGSILMSRFSASGE